MKPFSHSIRKQSLTIRVDSQETALSLQPRIDEINRRYFLPALERALNEVHVPGQQVRISGLTVDLGRLPLSELDSSLTERLYLRVREALRAILPETQEDSRPGVSVQPEQVSRLELLEHHLVRGTMPSWAPGWAGDSLEDLLLELDELDHDALVTTLYKCGKHSQARERMVRQLREPVLERLLRLLEPKHAELILSYIVDLKNTHDSQPVLPLSDSEFARLIWLVVLAYVVEEPGSQFNRKSFAKSLLTGMAEAEGMAYEEVLHILYIGVEQTGKRLPLDSSLPTIIRELARESTKEPGTETDKVPSESAISSRNPCDSQNKLRGSQWEAPAGTGLPLALDEGALLEALRSFLLRGEMPESYHGVASFNLQEGLLQIAQFAPDELVEMIRASGIQASARERLVAHFDRPVLRRLIHLLEPHHSEVIILYVADLIEIHRCEPLLPVSDEKFDAIVWSVVLAYVLDNQGSQFNRKTFLKTLLRRMSNAQGLAYQEVVSILHLGVKRTMKKLTLQSSLLAIIQDLASEVTEMTEHVGSGQQDSTTDARSMLADSRTCEEFSQPRISDGTLLATSRYDVVDALRYYTKHGVLPWSLQVRCPGTTVAALMDLLSRISPLELEAMLCKSEPEELQPMLLCLAAELPEETFLGLLQKAFPKGTEHGRLLLDAVTQFAASAKDKPTFYARVVAAVLEKRALDLEEFARAEPGQQQLQPGDHSLPESPAEREPHALKSVILSRLRSGCAGSRKYPPQSELLEKLVSKHPQEARHFFRLLRAQPALLSAFVEQCPAPLVAPIAVLVRPADAAMIHSLIQILARVVPGNRTDGEDSVRRTILAELLRLDAAETIGQDFLARVLNKLFAVPLPQRLCKLLQRQLARLGSSGRLSKAEVKALASALDEAVSPPAQAVAEVGRPKVQAPPGPLADTHEAAMSFLLGEDCVHAHVARDTLERCAADPHPPEQYSVDTLQFELQAMMEQAPQELRVAIESSMSDSQKRHRWIEILPEASLAGLVRLFEPQKYRVLLDTAEMLAAACRETLSSVTPASSRKFMWSFLLDFMAHNGEGRRSPARMITSFFEHVAEQAKARTSDPALLPAIGNDLLQNCERLARASGRSGLLVLLAANRRLLRSFWNPLAGARSGADSVPPRGGKQSAQRPPQQPSDKRPSSRAHDQAEGAADDPIYIKNAGLVLAGTFLPHFFESLNLLEDSANGRCRIRNGEGTSRAVHLLQYLVDGSCSTPEPLLVLNKIMCGLEPETPVSREIDLENQERELCDRLLTAMIANWKAIANTSVAGLRETFLQREGKLVHAADGWRLQVQRKTLDVLVDQIPWSMSVIYHRWMPEPLYVKW